MVNFIIIIFVEKCQKYKRDVLGGKKCTDIDFPTPNNNNKYIHSTTNTFEVYQSNYIFKSNQKNNKQLHILCMKNIYLSETVH